jgi:hypothetical protein
MTRCDVKTICDLLKIDSSATFRVNLLELHRVEFETSRAFALMWLKLRAAEA